MGYTATQMYDKFMLTVNESANDSILSWDVASFLNQAQYQLFNELVAPRSKIGSLRGQAPFVINEENLQNADQLTPFKRQVTGLTSGAGYLYKPSEAEYIASVGVYDTLEVCESEELIAVEFLRENELLPKMKNSFTKPTGNETTIPDVRRSNIKYTTLPTGNRLGLQFWPQQQFRYRLIYYKRPQEIAIQNPTEETYLAGTSNYQAQPFDVNCEFLQTQQDEIIRRAVSMFSASTGNYESMQADIMLNQEDRN